MKPITIKQLLDTLKTNTVVNDNKWLDSVTKNATFLMSAGLDDAYVQAYFNVREHTIIKVGNTSQAETETGTSGAGATNQTDF